MRRAATGATGPLGPSSTNLMVEDRLSSLSSRAARSYPARGTAAAARQFVDPRRGRVPRATLRPHSAPSARTV
jgi:hypothetical protein